VVVGLTVAAAAAALALGPIEPATTGRPAAVFVGLAYPAGALLLLALTARSLAITGWRTEPSWALLTAGFALLATANQAVHGSYLEGTLLDACWSGAFLLIAAAAWVSETHAGPRPNVGRAPLFLPVACTVVALDFSG
jgi:diguanylate cyclase